MTDMLLDIQIPLLATVLLLASLAKLTVRGEAPAPPVRPHRHPSFVYGLALAEGAIGVSLLVTQLGIVRMTCVVFFARPRGSSPTSSDVAPMRAVAASAG